MPRSPRLDAPGVLHHIMIRGIGRCKIFRSDKDREDFLLFRTGAMPLATLMRRLLTGYALGFNLRHKRHGQLFQNRYKSIVCQEDAYLKELVRYIHLNPLRAGLVGDLEGLNQYAYSGHGVLMGGQKRAWQDVDYVLGYFGRTVRRSRKAYLDYVASGVEQGRRDELMGGGLIRSVGGWSEVQQGGHHRDR